MFIVLMAGIVASPTKGSIADKAMLRIDSDMLIQMADKVRSNVGNLGTVIPLTSLCPFWDMDVFHMFKTISSRFEDCVAIVPFTLEWLWVYH